MFQTLFRRAERSAERSINSIIAKYVGRVTVAIPLVIAGGFATAALTIKLVELYGAATACASMAVLYVVVGVLTAAVSFDSQTPAEIVEQSVSEEATQAANEVEDLLTPEVRAVLASAAPLALPTIIRTVLRNLPLVVLLGIAAYIVSLFASTSAAAGSDTESAMAPPV